MALLFGNEHEGPSADTLAACTGTFRIPMAGFTQSFNVSVAAGIALAHLASARRRHLGRAGDLPETARVALRDSRTAESMPWRTASEYMSRASFSHAYRRPFQPL